MYAASCVRARLVAAAALRRVVKPLQPICQQHTHTTAMTDNATRDSGSTCARSRSSSQRTTRRPGACGKARASWCRTGTTGWWSTLSWPRPSCGSRATWVTGRAASRRWRQDAASARGRAPKEYSDFWKSSKFDPSYLDNHWCTTQKLIGFELGATP